MKQLLSFQERRIVNILYALTIDHEYMTLKQIQEMNECSDRTVQSDIDTIKEFWDGRVTLRAFEHVVFLENRSLGKLQQYIYEVLEQSLPCNLLISIFYNPEENMEFHAMETHISTSHAQRTLTDINGFLTEQGITVSKASGKHFLEGNSEMNLRNFMSEFLLQYRPILKSFPNKDLLINLIKITEAAFDFHGIKLNELLLNQLALTLYLSILREKQGFKILDGEDQFSNFKPNLPEDFEFTQEEIKTGLGQFNDLVFLYHNNTKLRNTILENTKNFSQLEPFKNILIRHEAIADAIFLFMIMVYVNTTKLGRLLDRTVLFGQETQKVRTELFAVINKEIEKYDSNLNNFIKEHMDVLVFWVAIELKDYDLRIPRSILVISDLGNEHAEDLRIFIQIYFGHHTFKTGSTINGLSDEIKEKIDHFDLIISTTILDFDPGVPIIEINDFVSASDLARIFVALR